MNRKRCAALISAALAVAAALGLAVSPELRDAIVGLGLVLFDLGVMESLP